MGVHGTEARTSVCSSDTTVKTGDAYIFWVTANNSHATNTSAIELEDTGTDVWAVVLDAVDGSTGTVHALFDPPIHCTTGITVDITGGTALVTVGYE